MWIRSCVVLCVAASAACPTSHSSPVAATTTAVAVPAVAPATMIAVAPAVRDELAAWTLTASDGGGLALVRVDAKAVALGPLAFTELHLYFRNAEDRVREGTLQLTLPARAAVSRFAMESAGQWLEAEVVPKVLARRAYEDFLHRRQDPALLEKAAGNQFTARVFPIAARSDKHLVLGYIQELPGAAYALPLRGLPRAERVDVELQYTGGDGVRRFQRLAERDWQPDRDFVAESPVAAAAVGAGPLIAAQIEIATAGGRDAPRGVALLVDTSASRALGFDAHVAAIARLAGELGAAWGDALPLSVIAFDQDAELIFDGRAADFAAAHARRLVERGAAGAADLGRALAWLAAHRAAAKPRVLVIGDGVITAGAEGAELAAAVGRLSAAGVERLDVALAGGLRDEATAALLVRSGLPRAGAVFDLDSAGGDRLAAALGDAVATDVPVTVAGAAWVYPRTIASARPGTRAMVHARLAEPAATVDIAAGGAPVRLRVQPVAAPLVERAIAGAEIAELEARLASVAAGDAPALRAAIAQRSVAARVLSSETSLLVLESDADHARYRIDRKALADILVVGPGGVEVQHRAGVAPRPPRPPRAPGSTPPAPSDGPALRPGERPPAPGDASAGDRNGDRIAAANADRTATPDSDHDGIPDLEDRCPDGADDGDGDGCPVRGRVIVTDAAIEVLDNVYFESDRATIQPASLPILDAVADTLRRNPDIRLVEIQGHSDERGDAGHNLELSQLRAEAVRQYLVGKGIAEARLSSQGYGAAFPVDRRHNPEARAHNRRVAFLILRRGDDAPPGSASGAPPTSASGTAPPPAAPPPPAKPSAPPAPVTGELAAIQGAIRARDLDGALAQAHTWHAREPGSVLALIGLGEALEARRAGPAAARIYGSIIDLYPGRADMRRFAGERLARLPAAGDLAIDTFRRAVADRPDHMTGHRLLAYALVRAGRPADAFAAILAGLDQRYGANRHAGGLRALGDDAGMIGAVYAIAAPARRAEIAGALARRHLALATRPSTRFLLYWETDANDVDLHIRDARGEHAYFDHPHLASGGELYADVTTGYGPECFAIPGKPAAGPYALSVDYYAQGPMGYGMGLLEIQTFDPQRGLTFDDRPYVVMTNHATLELGTYR